MRHIREAFKHLIPSQGLGLMGDLATDNDLKKEGRARGKKEKRGKEDEERIG